jgi:hypothetical protein
MTTADRRRRNGALLRDVTQRGTPSDQVRLWRQGERPGLAFDQIVLLVEPECPDPIGPVEFACTRLATAAGER